MDGEYKGLYTKYRCKPALNGYTVPGSGTVYLIYEFEHVGN